MATVTTNSPGLARVRRSDLPYIDIKREYNLIAGGLVDNTAKILQAITDIGDDAIYGMPFGQYLIEDTIPWPVLAKVQFNGTELIAGTSLTAKPMMTAASGAYLAGQIFLNGDDQTDVVGFQLGGAVGCQQAVIDALRTENCTKGVRLWGATGTGVYLNRFNHIYSRYNDVNLEIGSDGVSPFEANANHFGFVSLQNSTVDAIAVDGGDNNTFDYLECESNSGDAIDLKRAFGFTVNGGWIEGNGVNIRIADNPAVLSVYICASVDSNLDSADTKLVYTASTNRAVHFRTALDARLLGKTGIETLRLGDYGVAASDQNRNPIAISGGMDCYRKTASGYFYFTGQSGLTGFTAVDGAGATLYDITATRMVLPVSLTLSGATKAYILGIEIADPAAPAANQGIVYFRDNGSGKGQFVARFPTGAVQVIATEP